MKLDTIYFWKPSF